MKTKSILKRGAILAASFIVLVSLFGNSRSYTYKETAVPTTAKLSPRLQALFEKTPVGQANSSTSGRVKFPHPMST